LNFDSFELISIRKYIKEKGYWGSAFKLQSKISKFYLRDKIRYLGRENNDATDYLPQLESYV